MNATTTFEKQWLFAPRILALPFEVRAAWCALAMSEGPVRLTAFITQLKLSAEYAGRLLAALLEAGLIRMDGHVVLDPSFTALPAADIPEIARQPSPLSTVIPTTDEPPLFH